MRRQLASRALWLELPARRDPGQSPAWVDECGSIHLAYRADEWAVLEEFAERAPALGYKVRRLDREAALDHSPAANPRGLLGGLYSSTDLSVDPRAALPALAAWLNEQPGVEIHFKTAVRSVDGKTVETADGKRIAAGRTLVCSGADFETLFPDLFTNSGLRRCKLQMLRTRVQPDNWRIGPHVASGLTLRHYRNFEVCESLAALKRRVQAETPELDRYGIHVMASQNGAGEVILGDSHEYDAEITPFDKARIDELMLRGAPPADPPQGLDDRGALVGHLRQTRHRPAIHCRSAPQRPHHHRHRRLGHDDVVRPGGRKLATLDVRAGALSKKLIARGQSALNRPPPAACESLRQLHRSPRPPKRLPPTRSP